VQRPLLTMGFRRHTVGAQSPHCLPGVSCRAAVTSDQLVVFVP
jgi:hypothetical protein